MAQATIGCPHCGQVLDATGLTSGQQVQCPSCGNQFAVPAQAPMGGGGGGFVPPQVNYATPAGFGYGTAKLPNPMARASLIFGILFFVLMAVNAALQVSGLGIAGVGIGAIFGLVALICPILAIVFGIIGLVKTKRGLGGKGAAITGIVLGGCCFVIFGCGISILLPSLNRARETANRVKCGSNMRQIGQAILLYSNENRGLYPTRLEDLIVTQELSSEHFVCPSSNDTASQGATLQQQAAGLTSQPGHLSYVYVGQKLNYKAGANIVVLYEPLTNHSKAGCNMLFGDGHVEWIGAAQATKMIAEVQAGKNPPPSYRGGF